MSNAQDHVPHPRPQRYPRFRALAYAVLGVGVLVMLGLLAGIIPGFLGTVAAVALPWLGIPALLAATASFALRRGWWVGCIPLLAWMLCIAPLLAWGAGSASNEASGLIVASQNVEAGSAAADVSARTLADQGADIIALTELDAVSREQAIAELEADYPYSSIVGTVGIWSVWPIAAVDPLDLELGWRRALHASLDAEDGEISVYVLHAASFRPGAHADRDTMLHALGDLVAADPSARVIAAGDFNAATTDPALDRLRKTLPNGSAVGFAPTWPAGFPVARIDHVFSRGFQPCGAETFPAGASDHLAISVCLASEL